MDFQCILFPLLERIGATQSFYSYINKHKSKFCKYPVRKFVYAKNIKFPSLKNLFISKRNYFERVIYRAVNLLESLMKKSQIKEDC